MTQHDLNLFSYEEPEDAQQQAGEKVEIHRFPIPDMTQSGAVAKLALRDIELVQKRIETAECAFEAFCYRDSIRVTIDEMAELCLSVADTASLCGFRHQGDSWRFEVGEHSPRGIQVVAALKELRATLLERGNQNRRFVVSGKSSVMLKRSVALMCIALDAVDRKYLQNFMMIAGISRASNDVTGDAQAFAEEYIANGELPFSN